VKRVSQKKPRHPEFFFSLSWSGAEKAKAPIFVIRRLTEAEEEELQVGTNTNTL